MDHASPKEAVDTRTHRRRGHGKHGAWGATKHTQRHDCRKTRVQGQPKGSKRWRTNARCELISKRGRHREAMCAAAPSSDDGSWESITELRLLHLDRYGAATQATHVHSTVIVCFDDACVLARREFVRRGPSTLICSWCAGHCPSSPLSTNGTCFRARTAFFLQKKNTLSANASTQIRRS